MGPVDRYDVEAMLRDEWHRVMAEVDRLVYAAKAEVRDLMFDEISAVRGELDELRDEVRA